MNKEFLKELLNTPSPSGNEIALQKKVYDYAQKFSDKVFTDYAANIYAAINPQCDYKVMLAAHCDEICLRIVDIEENGYLKVVNTGGVNFNMYLGHQVKIYNGKESIYGAVVANSKSYSSSIKSSDLYIDIGANSKDEAKKFVKHGDWVLFNNDLCELVGEKIMGRALDDRLGVFVIFEALRKAKEIGSKVSLYAVSTTNEETSSKGAYYAATSIKPDIAIVVDVTYASDFPGSAIGNTGKVVLGGGPVIDNGCTLNRILNKKIAEVAEKNNISVQYELSSGNTGTDERRIQYSCEGIPTVLISIPLRNMHSPAEVASLIDIENCINLIAELMVSIPHEGIDLDPFKEEF